MKELLKNKLFIIISLFVLLVTFISSSCFATSVTYEEETIELPNFINNYYYFIYFYHIGNSNGQYGYSYCYAFSHNPIYVFNGQLKGENGTLNIKGKSGSSWVTSNTPFTDYINSIPEPTVFNDTCWLPSSRN